MLHLLGRTRTVCLVTTYYFTPPDRKSSPRIELLDHTILMNQVKNLFQNVLSKSGKNWNVQWTRSALYDHNCQNWQAQVENACDDCWPATISFYFLHSFSKFLQLMSLLAYLCFNNLVDTSRYFCNTYISMANNWCFRWILSGGKQVVVMSVSRVFRLPEEICGPRYKGSTLLPGLAKPKRESISWKCQLYSFGGESLM